LRSVLFRNDQADLLRTASRFVEGPGRSHQRARTVAAI
jgi:hypothetical protein